MLSGIVWTPIRYVTLHSKDRRGADSLRDQKHAEIIHLLCEQRRYLVWFSGWCKSNPVNCGHSHDHSLNQGFILVQIKLFFARKILHLRSRNFKRAIIIILLFSNIKILLYILQTWIMLYIIRILFMKLNDKLMLGFKENQSFLDVMLRNCKFMYTARAKSINESVKGMVWVEGWVYYQD